MPWSLKKKKNSEVGCFYVSVVAETLPRSFLLLLGCQNSLAILPQPNFVLVGQMGMMQCSHFAVVAFFVHILPSS